MSDAQTRLYQLELDAANDRIAELEAKVKGYWASVNQDTVQEYVLAQINEGLRKRIAELEKESEKQKQDIWYLTGKRVELEEALTIIAESGEIGWDIARKALEKSE